MTVKIMFSFPDQLVSRMRAMIPSRERSKIIAILLEKELLTREKKLYLCAKALEKNKGLNKEIEAWDRAFAQDGLEDDDAI